MKKIVHVVIVSLAVFSMLPSVYAQDVFRRGMDPGGMMGGGSGHRSFKVADVNLDKVNEIIFLQGDTLTVMDNKGKVLFTKTVAGLDAFPWSNLDSQSAELKDRRGCNNDGWHFGDWHHGDWWPWREVNGKRVSYPLSSMMGGGSFEIANIDDDDYPEIIIEAYDKLIVLDHTGDAKLTIDLPVTNTYPWE